MKKKRKLVFKSRTPHCFQHATLPRYGTEGNYSCLFQRINVVQLTSLMFVKGISIFQQENWTEISNEYNTRAADSSLESMRVQPTNAQKHTLKCVWGTKGIASAGVHYPCLSSFHVYLISNIMALAFLDARSPKHIIMKNKCIYRETSKQPKTSQSNMSALGMSAFNSSLHHGLQADHAAQRDKYFK